MRLPTAIGTVVVETDWAPLLHFLEMRRSAFPAREEREVKLRVEIMGRAEIDQGSPSDPPETYPREVFIEGCRFVLSRDAILGRVPRDLLQVGLVVEWLWYALPVCCFPDDWECLHAAAVEREGGICLIFGEPGTGKTQAALDLLHNGWRYFADDVVLVNAGGTLARGWDNSLHLDPRTAAGLGDALTLDWCGKVRVRPPAPAASNQGRIVQVLSTGGKPRSRHEGPGFDSIWAAGYGAGPRLVAEAKAIPTGPLAIRVALVNRNPDKAPTRWEGGDMTNLRGYAEGLTALGIEAAFVPFDELDETRWDLIHLFHGQRRYPWVQQVVETTTKPLVVTAITQANPEPSEVAATVERASAVLCYSALEEEWYADRFPELPRERFLTVPQGVPSAIYAEHEPVPPTFSVFMAGRYSPVKNQLAVLQACRALDVPVVFAGMVDEGAGQYLLALRKELGEWRGARFFGRLQGAQLWGRYRAAHVHVQPSLFESFGLSTWEALAAGCNIAATANGWGKIIFAQHGSICEPEAESIRAAIQYELRLPRNRHGFRPPTWEQASRALIRVYREVLNAVA